MEKKKLRDVILKTKTENKAVKEPKLIIDKKPTTVLIWDGSWREVPIC
jgi:hypothetical protein